MACDSVFSLNVKGLRNKNKRKKVFNLFKREKYDFICLQETHITEDKADEWKNEWKDGFVFYPGTPDSCGQVILFSKSVSDEFSVLIASKRILAVEIMIKEKRTLLCNIYAPNNNSEKEKLFKELIDKIKDTNFDDIILCGDFNCVMNNDNDIITGASHNNNTIKELNNLVSSCDLYDTWRLFNPETKEYSWSMRSPFIARRLDYIFVSDNILDIASECRLISVPFSDHRGCLMRLKSSDIVRGKGYWKFNNSLLNDHTYVNEMNNFLENYSVESEDDQIALDVLKIQIKEFTINYSTMKRRKNKNDVIALYNELDDLDKWLSKHPDCVDTLKKRENIKLKLELQETEKARAAQVRSRAKWVELGEKNNSYFLGLEKVRGKAKIMEQVKDENGQILTDQRDIQNRQRHYFENLYKRKIDEVGMETKINTFMQDCDNVPCLTADEKDGLEAPLTEQELLRGLKELNNGSAPGSDGLTVEFFKMFWTRIKIFVHKSFESARETGSLSISQRNAIITLIHKGKQLPRNEMNNWRPISLTNTDYKIFAKCLAIRINNVIQKLINPDQVGYLKGRQVSSILRLIDDAIDQSNQRNNPGLIATFDMFHAFDCISKEFMLKTFKKFGFGPNFISLVSIIMKDARSCVNYAGWLSSYFPVSSGIRQGCPFSPMAFILAIELLAIKLRKNNNIKGLPLVTGIAAGQLDILKVALYADDLTLFLTDENDLKHALNVFANFEKVSGLALNIAKCEAMWIGRNKFRHDTHCNFKWKTKIKILGIYFSNSVCASLIEENYTERIEKIKRLISAWEKRNLSIMGKIIIAKTFLISQLVYFMQAFIIPEKVLTEINRILFRFIWKKRDNNKKAFEKVKRVVMCNDYTQGGLKMIDIKQMQISFILQWVIRLTGNLGTNKCAIIPRMIFLSHGPNFECFRSNVNSKSFKGLDHIKSFFWSSVLKTWLDNNCTPSNTVNQYLWNNKSFAYAGKTLYFRNWAEKGLTSLQDIIDQNEIMPYQSIRGILGNSANILEYNVVAAVINRYLATNPENVIDDVALQNKPTFRNSNVQDAKQIRNILITLNKSTPWSHSFWKRKFNYDIDEKDWQMSFMYTKESRLRVLQWKILHNIYPTNILLCKMRVTENNFCSYCADTVDFIEHFFFLCPVVLKFWKDVELFILRRTGKNVKLGITDVIFGIKDNNELSLESQRKDTNHIILIGKMCISIFKKTNSNALIYDIFEKHCALRGIQA